MKKPLAILALLSVGFVAGMSWKELIAHAGGGGGVPVGNGDVNGDGVIDLSDAVYTLTWLFVGGEAPKAIECPPPVGKGLPGTGETVCYDAAGTEIACDSADFPGQDGTYQAGCASEGRFIDNGDGTVTDACTGLMWQKDTAPGTYIWQYALKYCEDLDFAGHDDWRLPNVRELQSIVDYGRHNPSIDPMFEAVSDWYWSSSSDVIGLGAGVAWHVYFGGGYVNSFADVRVAPYYVRAVRVGP